MESTYKLCLKLIESYKRQGKSLATLADKFDVYYAAGRLTETEYNDLMSKITENTATTTTTTEEEAAE